MRDLDISREHAFGCDSMLLPGAALRVEVVKLRDKAIERGGEARFRGRGALEFMPQRLKFLLLIGRQQSEDSLGCALLSLRLITLGIVDIRVAGIDFDDVVNENHPDDLADVEGLVGMLGENDRHKREMPAVLGGILTASAVQQISAPVDTLQLVEFKDEVELLRQSVHVPPQYTGRRLRARLERSAATLEDALSFVRFRHAE